MDIRLALMCGSDIPVPECQVVLHQPTIKEISLIGEADFFTGIQCLCIDKNRLAVEEEAVKNKTNFELFMTIFNQKEDVEKKLAIQQVCTLLFPNFKVNFTPRSIMLLGGPTPLVIDSNNFDFLQQAIALIGCLKSSSKESQDFNPANQRAMEIAKKLMKGRQKVAQERAAREGDSSIISQYISILTIGLHSMGLQDIMGLTLYQLYDLVERYKLFTSWDLDIKSRLAGGSPESQPEDWMKNLH